MTYDCADYGLLKLAAWYVDGHAHLRSAMARPGDAVNADLLAMWQRVQMTMGEVVVATVTDVEHADFALDWIARLDQMTPDEAAENLAAWIEWRRT